MTLRRIIFAKAQGQSRSSVEDLINSADKKIRRAFREVQDSLTSEFTVRKLQKLIEDNNTDEILRILTSLGSKFARRVLEQAYIAAADAAAEYIADSVKVTVDFDQTNVRATERMRTRRLDLIREIVEEQRAVIQQVLMRNIEPGSNPLVAAKELRDSLGLTRRQEAAVSNFRRLLASLDSEAMSRELRDKRFDRTIRRAIRDGQQLSREQIDKMVARYRHNYIAYRARTIARTEALRSVHEGTADMYEQAYEEGTVKRSEVRRKWLAARDSRVRDSHSAMNGQVRGSNEAFESPSGAHLMWPGDATAPASETINCRCVVVTRIVQDKTEELPN